jgi:hypothetical protein
MVRPARSRLFSSLLLAAVFLLLATSTATADAFSSTFNFGNINVADGSTPPQFFTGPFNYGVSSLGLDSAESGLVHITDISVSADAVVNSPLVLQNGDLVAFNWEIYVGPSPFGFVPGQVTGSFTRPDTLARTAPTLLQFSQSDFWTSGPPLTRFGGNYDFTTQTMATMTGAQTIVFFAGTVPYDANGLYVQAFLWTEADDNMDLNNIKVTVSGTTVPEPSSLLMLGSGLFSVVTFAGRKLRDLNWR